MYVVSSLHSSTYQEWLSVLLESRDKGDSIPGASGVIGESGATAAALSALKAVAKDIKCAPHQHYHTLLFVGDKMLALYSRYLIKLISEKLNTTRLQLCAQNYSGTRLG